MSSLSNPTAALAGAHRRRENRIMLALVAPSAAIVFLLLVLPMAWLLWQSFYDKGFTLVHYQRIFSDPAYLGTFWLTFRISLITTLLALLLGYPVAFAAAAAPPRWRLFILTLVLIPLWTSVLVRAYAWLILLQRTGVINKTLMGMGWIDQPLSLIHNELGTLIGTTHILLPFMILPMYATMQKIPRDLLMAGASLGGSPSHVFWRVFFPLSLPGMLAGTTLVFVLCLGFYITPELLGGGKTMMVSMLVSRNVELYNQWGAASAVSVVLLLCVFAVFAVIGRILPIERIVAPR